MAIDWQQRLARREPPAGGVIAADFRFTPADFLSLRAYSVAQESVGMTAVPLAVERIVHLTHGSDSLRVEVDLVLDGAAAARALLARHLGGFQRAVPDDAVLDLRAAGIGDVGAAWSWGREDRNGVAGFTRHNVVVFLLGRYDGLVEVARDLDVALARLPTADGYADTTAALFPAFAPAAATPGLRVSPGERLDLGAPAERDGDYFFLAEGGAVNRDPREPDRRYFRAGLAPGRYRIAAFRVGAGLLPQRQTFTIVIA